MLNRTLVCKFNDNPSHLISFQKERNPLKIIK